MIVNGHYVTAPSLPDVFDAHADDIFSKLRVCMPGIIQTYDVTKRTATVAPARNYELNDGTILSVDAPILDVPVVTMQGGGAHVAFPIKKGDECLMIFADFNIDAWYANGGVQTPNDGRRHDISDAIAIVGPNSLGNALLSALGPTEAGLATATTKVAIDTLTGLVNVSNGPLPINSLGGILDVMLTAMGSATTVPQIAAAATAAKAALAALLY